MIVTLGKFAVQWLLRSDTAQRHARLLFLLAGRVSAAPAETQHDGVVQELAPDASPSSIVSTPSGDEYYTPKQRIPARPATAESGVAIDSAHRRVDLAKGNFMMTWTVGDVIAATLRAFQRNWGTLMVTSLLAWVIAFAPALLWMAIEMPQLHLNHDALPAHDALSLFLSILSGVVLMILFAPAMSRIALAAARGEQPRIGQLFDFRRAFSFLAAGLLAWVSIVVATLLLIIPGIIVATGLAWLSSTCASRRLRAHRTRCQRPGSPRN